MAAFPTLSLSSLPALPLPQRNRLPEHPAIYFAIDSKERVLYIGKASNLLGRWKEHHRLEQLSRIHKRSPVHLAWLDCSQMQEHLDAMEKYYIGLYQPLLNGTPVPPKKITPAEVVLRDTLLKIAKYTIVFGIAPESSLHALPTVSLRYMGDGRVVHTLRRIFKASNQKPSGLQWSEFVRRKYGGWWRTRCNGVAIELAPWTTLRQESQHLRTEATVQRLAGVELAALHSHQLAELIERHAYLEENYPGITTLNHDPIRLLWASLHQVPESQESTPLPSLPATTILIPAMSAPLDPNLSPSVRQMQRTFLKIEGVEVEVCTDSDTNKFFVRHNLFWKLVHNKTKPDLQRNNVISNLQQITDYQLTTIRWVGFGFKVDQIYFAEDGMKTEAVMLPLALFEDLIRYEYQRRNQTGYKQEDDCRKLGQWLEKNTIIQLMNR